MSTAAGEAEANRLMQEEVKNLRIGNDAIKVARLQKENADRLLIRGRNTRSY